ncbi:MAG: hypothetical protein D3909_03035, partial [Candidatus Electrothrix sp. ATG1]|nr:hypothetical protein [Candidatus Electrothrix sp. ATG1]
AGKKRLGELLVQQEIVSNDTINDALRVQVGGNRRLGHILVQMKALTEDQLADILSHQMEIPLTDIDATFSSEVKQVLPRYLCRKYDVIPLSLQKNNILLTAMADPSDHEAIADIEHYTGMVVEPCLAKHSDISQAISKKISYSFKDTFNPQTSTHLNRTISLVALVLVIIFGLITYNYMRTARYGTTAHLTNSTIYKHLNMSLDFDQSGKINLSGRSAFADGYYSVAFNGIESLRSFIASRKDHFSVEQNNWLEWVLKEENKKKTL